MQKTKFAGLTRLSPGEAVSADNYAFQTVDRDIIDRLLELGAHSHRHDAHPALADPTAEVTLAVEPTDGLIPGDTTISVVYTLIDADGGETLPAEAASVTTDPPMDAADEVPEFDVEYTAGDLLAGSYFYGMTLTDGAGGETPVGPTVQIDVDPGHANAQIVFSGLGTIATDNGAYGWRLYKASQSGTFTFLATGTTGEDGVTDDGHLCTDCTETAPGDSSNTTAGTNALLVTLPASDSLIAAASGIRIYIGVDGDFTSPSFVEQLPITAAGTTRRYAALLTAQGSPPDVSTSVPGATKIDPDTELLDWNWKRPVATRADLPAGDQGDIRVTLDDGRAWVVLATSTTDMLGWSLLRASGPVPNEVQSYEITNAAGGTYKLVFDGQATDDITLNQPLAVIQSAIEAVLGFGNAAVTQAAGNGPIQVTYQGALAGRGMPLLQVDIAGLTWAGTGPQPAVAIARDQIGGVGGHEILDEGTPLEARGKLDFVGDAVTVTDDPATDRTVVTITGTGGPGGGTDGFAGATYTQEDIDSAIPDAGGGVLLTDVLNVPDSAVIGTDTDFPELWIWLEHPFVSDLDVSLIGPDSTLYDVVVEDGPNDSLGTGFDENTRAVVSPNAAIVMNNTSAAYVGRVKPSDSNTPTPWAAMTGKNITGDWQLRIQDQSAGDAGVLHSWGLNFTAGLPAIDTVIIAVGKNLEFRDGGPYGALKGELEVINTVASPGWPEWTLRARMYEDDGTEHITTLASSASTRLVDYDQLLTRGAGLDAWYADPNPSVHVYAKGERVYLDFEGTGTVDGISDVLAAALPLEVRAQTKQEIFVHYRTPMTDAGGALVYGEFWSFENDGTIKREANAGVTGPEIHAHISWRRA